MARAITMDTEAAMAVVTVGTGAVRAVTAEVTEGTAEADMVTTMVAVIREDTAAHRIMDRAMDLKAITRRTIATAAEIKDTADRRATAAIPVKGRLPTMVMAAAVAEVMMEDSVQRESEVKAQDTVDNHSEDTEANIGIKRKLPI